VEQVSERAGVSRTVVSNLENGRGATLENTLKVTRALGILDVMSGALDPYRSDVGRLRSEEALPNEFGTVHCLSGHEKPILVTNQRESRQTWSADRSRGVGLDRP
jgi:transcriptional regulator with XRE-family HTH domain